MKTIVITFCLCIGALCSYSQTENLFSKFENGDIVSSSSGTKRADLGLCSTKSNDQLIGVYFKSDIEIEIEKEDQDLVFNPIKSTGFISVKYNEENGAVKKGDLITSSSTPGVGMKATSSGIILGIAIEDGKKKKGLVKIRVMIQYVKQ